MFNDIKESYACKNHLPSRSSCMSCCHSPRATAPTWLFTAFNHSRLVAVVLTGMLAGWRIVDELDGSPKAIRR